jgi:hypothetical protein
MVKDKKPDNDAKGTAADPRFAAVQYDPRFQRFPKNKSKVQVDDRFKGKLSVDFRPIAVSQQSHFLSSPLYAMHFFLFKS